MSPTEGQAPDGTDTELQQRLLHYDDPQAAMRALLALDAGGLGSWRWDIAANTTTGDPFLADLFGLDHAAQPWPSDLVFGGIHPDDLPAVQGALERAMAGDDEFAAEFRELRTDTQTGAETIRWLYGRGRVTRRGPDGAALEMLGVTSDVTERKTHEERLGMLAAEMDHRVKNAFAVMRSLVRLGSRQPGSKKDFADTLANQIQALADAHAVSARLARQSQAPTPVPLSEILQGALSPWLDGAGAREGQVTLTMEDGLAVNARRVSVLAMLCYELATNAAKHGALRDEGGRLAVEALAEGDDIVLRWTERAVGARTVHDDAETGLAPGFGTLLIQHCVSGLSGRVDQNHSPDGLHFTLRFPAADPAMG